MLSGARTTSSLSAPKLRAFRRTSTANPAASKSFKLDGRVRPQAARFRIFEYEKGADGKFHPKGEVTLGDGRTTKITWTVHLANRKASFCQFRGQEGALASPLFSKYSAKQMRNPAVLGADNRRSTLDLDPGPRSIEGGAGSPRNLCDRPSAANHKHARRVAVRQDRPPARHWRHGSLGLRPCHPTIGQRVGR